MEKKYIFVDGIMQLNPNFKKSKNSSKTTVSDPKKALAVVSSTKDIQEATDLHKKYKQKIILH